ncbi:DNA-directed RNA polymerase subunit alpha C-terminal domain-containing protein [Scytonema sp. NUACC26]|uniref:DNA-directed RNA polymerase subunit alpha C-terminal domain-containing protein n=1 Tax=Scytonema sp. NUACC26 TaxID=3140176 RepID=UPI0034DC869F
MLALKNKLVTNISITNKGGQGKKADYKTLVVRVPEPIYDEVRSLIDAFHAKPVTSISSNNDSKPVTSINLEDGILALGLKNRAYMSLKRNQINTVQGLIEFKHCLTEVKGLGEKSASEIRRLIDGLLEKKPLWDTSLNCVKH